MGLEDFGCRGGVDWSAPVAVVIPFERSSSWARDEIDARLLGAPMVLEGITDACDSRAMQLEAHSKWRGKQRAGGKKQGGKNLCIIC
jgi:hypothetical protein